METDISKFFVDICNRGCIIDTGTRYKYATKDLPKCLVLVDDEQIDFNEFVIKSIIPNNNCVTFKKNYFAEYIYIIENHIFRFNKMEYAKNLDLITTYVHYNNKHALSQFQIRGEYLDSLLIRHDLTREEYFDQLIQHIKIYMRPLGNIINYKQIIKNKMIENLTELYLIKFMYLATEILSLPEIKIVIVEILFKLDKWDNLQIC